MYWRKYLYLRWQVQEEVGLVFADKVEKNIKCSISCLVGVTHGYIISFVQRHRVESEHRSVRHQYRYTH